MGSKGELMKRLILSLLLGAFLVSGCNKSKNVDYSQNGPVADGDMLVESSVGDAKTLSPPLMTEATGGDIINLVFNGLLRYNEKLELEGCLVEKWVVSPDGKLITYHLRHGVKFHDGVEFTSDDVLFTYKVFTDPKTNTPYGSDYRYIDHVTAPDKYTVKVFYKQPFAPALSATFNMIIPKHLLEGKDINTCDFGRHPVGTGPFKFTEWKTAQKIVLDANPDYWEGKPHLKRFVLRIIPDQASEFLSLLKGEIDAIGALTTGSMSAEQYARQALTDKFTSRFNKYDSNQFVYTFIGWNLENPLFKDKDVRTALTLALDRNAIIQNVTYGLAKPCTGPFVPFSWAYNPEVKPLPFDPEKAKQLLKKAGWVDTDGDGILDKDLNHDGKRVPFSFKLYTSQGSTSQARIATILQDEYKAVGIKVETVVMEWTVLLSEYVEKRKYDAMVMGWQFGPEPDCFLSWHSSQTGPHQYNQVDYRNPEVDRLLVEGRTTLDRGKRQAIYRRIHKILYDDQPCIFLYVPPALSAVHKRFKGYRVTDVGLTGHPEQWYVPTTQQLYQP
jgi:peptide/nickel transport system substrate-binding protein